MIRLLILSALLTLLSLSSCKKPKDGLNSLIHTSEEPAGTNCPYGGTKIESGLDANRNGTLEASEVDAGQTKYTCSNAPTVLYSAWIDANKFSGIGNWQDTLTTSYHRRAIHFASTITQAVYDKGVVLVYIEDNYSSTKPVTALLPYRVSLDVNDHDDFNAFINVGKITFTWQAIQNGILDLSGMTPNVRYRYIVVPEGAAIPNGGRVVAAAQLKRKSYQEVIALFNIPKEGASLE